MIDITGKPTVNTPSVDYEAMEVERKLPRALVGKTAAMRKGGAEWAPRLKEETDDELKERLSHYYLVDFYDQAVCELIDRMFSRGIVLSDDVPPAVLALWENIDGSGRSGNKFFYDVAIDACRYGYSAVQCDHTERPKDSEGLPRTLTDAETAEYGARPFLVHRKAQNVIAVDQAPDTGLPVVDRVRIRETIVEPEGEFGQKVRELVRMISRGAIEADGGVSPSSYQVWEQDEESKEWRVVDTGTHAPPLSAPPDIARRFREVFLTPFYMGFERFHYARPGFRGAADLCLQHWQKKGDVDFIEHLANTPSVVLQADGDIKITALGSRKVITIPFESKLYWLVIDPKGVEATKASIHHLEEHIRETFNQPRRIKAGGQELVGVRLMDESQSMTRAQMWAIGIAQSITQCLNHLAWWLELPSGGTAEFPEDAMEKLANPQGFSEVIAMGKSRLLSKSAVQREAVRYGVLDEDHDIEEDLQALATEAPELPDFGGAGDEGGDAS